MNLKDCKKAGLASLLLLTVGYAQGLLAHSAGGAIDATGSNASSTDLATVTCYDDGDGPTAYLFIQIQDFSAPVPGLLLSMQAYKGSQMINDTDSVSGDANASPGAKLYAGDGTYYISVSKTAAGVRTFSVNYHCMTAQGTHTGTDINLLQAQ